MFKPCNCKTTKNQPCKSNGAFTIGHEDHKHDVCDAHNKKATTDISSVVFMNCDTAKKKPNLTKEVTMQPALPIPNTDGLQQVEHLKEILNLDPNLIEVQVNTEETQTAAREKIMARITTHENPEDNIVQTVEPTIHRIMVTGHTHVPNETLLEDNFKFLLEEYINTYGKERIVAVSGGALGADKLWARAAYKMDVPYEVYVPTGYEHVFIALTRYNDKPQDERVKDQANFKRMLELASAVYDENGNPRPENGRYARGANFVRNTTMVRKSQHYIAFCDTDPRQVIRTNRNGGTYHCIREMKRLGVTSVRWIPAQVETVGVINTVQL